MEMFLLIQVMMKIGMILPHKGKGRKVLDKLLIGHQMEKRQTLRME